MRLIHAVTIALLASCGQGSRQGELGDHCYPNGTCNVTLACVGGMCVVPPLDADVDGPFDTSPDSTPIDAPADTPRDAYCEPIDAAPPSGHHKPPEGLGCMSAAGCHNQALGLGAAAPAYSYAGMLYKADKTTPYGGATIVVKRGTAEKRTIVSDNGEFFVVPGIAGLDPPTNVMTATTWASGCPDVVSMVGVLPAGGGNCDSAACHAPGSLQGVIYLP